MRRAFFFIVAVVFATTSYASIPRASMLDSAPPIATPSPETRIRVSDVLAPFEQPAESELTLALRQAYEQASTTSASGLAGFLSVDPLLGDPAVPQSWNRYSYALNNPINFTDPSGMKPCKMTLPDGTEVEGECIDVEAEADDVEEVDWEQATSDFFAGFGDSLTFGGTKVIREAISQALFDTNTPVNPCSAAYALGEYTEIGLELAATGGSAGLRVAASQASRRAVRSAARAATRGASREAGQVIHHANPLFGHPGGASTLFPTGGLPASIHSGSWNLQALSHAEHMAAHRYLRQLERGASIAVNPGTTAARAGRNLTGQQQCGG